jgi:23S rRNA pseudouridine1911/1915/1917 synthase
MTKIVAAVAGRVDKAIAHHFPDAGRRQLASLFDDGCVKVAGKRAKKGDRIEVGAEIELSREPASGDALRPLPDPTVQFDVLVLRDDFVAIAKPAGMPSQPLRAGELGTAANGIVARWPECAAIGDDPRDGGLVHRLDIGTSGVLIAARTEAGYRALRDAFAAGRVTKTYLAITDGRPVARGCDAPLAQRGNHVAVDVVNGLDAQTEFVVERSSHHHALVRCTAHTGRMHQVRAHLAHVGSPISGDTLYGGKPLGDGFWLHASKVELPDVVIEAPAPAAFTAALAAAGL